MKNVTIYRLLMLWVVALLIGCEPASNLPNAFEQHLREGHAIGQKFQRVFYPDATMINSEEAITGSSANLLLGKAGGYTSWILIRSKLSSFTHIDSAKIKSINLTLYPMDSLAAIGDSTSQFMATANSINQTWDELNITWTDFNQNYQANPLVENVLVSGMGTAPIYFKLDLTSLIHADSTLDSSFINHGICLRGSDLPGSNLIRRFYSCDAGESAKRPTLTLIFSYKSKLDTLYDTYGYDAFVVKREAEIPDNPANLLIGKGLAYRSLLKFNLESIASNATINRVQFKLVFNADESFPGLESDRNVTVFPITQWTDDPAQVTIDSTSAGIPSTLEADTLTIELQSEIQDWVVQNITAEGLFVRAYNQGHDIARLALFGVQADSLLRPKLIIDYTLPPTN